MSAKNIKHLGSSLDTKSLQLGELPMKAPPNVSKLKELGEILGYDEPSKSYIVLTHGVGGDAKQAGGKRLEGVPRKIDNPGTVGILVEGTTVIVDWSLGFPYIDGMLAVDSIKPPQQTRRGAVDAKVNSPLTSYVANPDNSSQQHWGYYGQPGEPDNLLNGDQAIFTPDGNRIVVGRGNYNVIDGGPSTKSKIELFGLQDLVRLTCENFELFTGFGRLGMYNDQGRCGLKFTAAADQLFESGGTEELWTLKLDIGDAGEFLNLEICDSAGASKAKFNITPNGRVTLLATDGLDLINGGDTPSHEEHKGPVIKRFFNKVSTWISGAITEVFQGSRNTTISELDKKIVGHDESTFVNHDKITSVGNNVSTTITGGAFATAKPTNIAEDKKVLNGSVVVDVGNPKHGANPAAMAGYSVYVNNGSVTFGSNLAQPSVRANVNLNTLLPDSVALGGTVETSVMHAMMYEMFEAFMTTFLAQFDAHVHIPVNKPTQPISPVLIPMLQTIKSTRVKIGA